MDMRRKRLLTAAELGLVRQAFVRVDMALGFCQTASEAHTHAIAFLRMGMTLGFLQPAQEAVFTDLIAILRVGMAFPFLHHLSTPQVKKALKGGVTCLQIQALK